VLYVGGLVWALDWCPRPEQETDSDIKCEVVGTCFHLDFVISNIRWLGNFALLYFSIRLKLISTM